MAYHDGEIAVQSLAGVRMMAERIGRGIYPSMPPIAMDFLSDQTIAAVSSVDAAGDVWASLLTGTPGFLDPLDEQTLHIYAQPAADDPFSRNLAVNPHLGLIAIDFASRSRVRVNGMATLRPDGLRMTVEQAYSNCPKYIQARTYQPAPHADHPAAVSTTGLTSSQSAFIAQADTFFIASYHAEGGADASHRGGNPGFIHVVNEGLLEFPDYSGNKMFNTLGNLTAYPHAGLLFLDFDRGATLQLSGETEVVWDAERLADFAGAERLIRFHIKQVIEHPDALPFHFTLRQYSPFNPV
ncbi:MAG: pyridoxamine 5-phosphate oxidase [Anaerolineaceae bacterium]|nr:pyridoxamine 5-phosphate oxidase [Anaerolineaceae bacterium]